MGAIIDTLLLGEPEIILLKNKYPQCVIKKITDSIQLIERYRLIVPGEDPDDNYYNFLVDNGIAMSSTNFRSRLESDARFTERMRTRAAITFTKRFKIPTSSEN